jgi:hypothetical protein
VLQQYGLFMVLALVSEIIGTISGFGSSILFVPVASMFFDFKAVLGITAVFHVFSNLSKIALFRKGIDKKVGYTLGIPAVVFVIAGALLTTLIDTKKIELMMNILLLGLSVYLLLNFNKQIKQTRSNLVIGGGVSGFLAGLTGTGGAIRGLTLSAFHLPKDTFIATSAFIDLGVDLSRSVVYVSNNYLPANFRLMIPFLIVISIVGSYLGKQILRFASEQAFRYLVLLVVLGTAAFQMVKYFS